MTAKKPTPKPAPKRKTKGGGERAAVEKPAPQRSVTRAKEKTCPDKRARLLHIVGLMERLEWERGRTGEILALQWGLHVDTVSRDAAEASRMVTGDPDEARRDITAGCRALFKIALERKDEKAARAIGELWANVSGAKTAERHEIVSATVNPAEAARLVREAFGDKALANGNTKP